MDIFVRNAIATMTSIDLDVDSLELNFVLRVTVINDQQPG